MDNLISLLRATGPAAVNQEVRSKILELVQTWATATENRHEFSYMGEVYKLLQKEGYRFPPRTTVASSMIDSSAVCDLIKFSTSPGRSCADLFYYSRQNGSTRMCVCAAVPPLRLRTANTTAETAVTALTNSALQRHCLSLTWESCSRCVSTMAATSNLPTSRLGVATCLPAVAQFPANSQARGPRCSPVMHESMTALMRTSSGHWL